MITILLGMVLSFTLTIVFTALLMKYLPKDGGRAFAHDGKLSAGKPRGAGIIFVLVFAVLSVIFGVKSFEMIIYIVLSVICMLTGYLDDAAKNPWNEYLKGLLDLIIAIGVAVTYLTNNDNTVSLAMLNTSFEINKIVYALLIIALVWVSINVTNCSDGVDGLSGTVGIITLLSFLVLMNVLGTGSDMKLPIIIFDFALLAYLWFNSTPSVLMMGDAGSRALGLIIAISALKSNAPFMFIPFTIVFILDGGLGLIKVSLLRFLKIRILKNTRTPLHDQVRKVDGWSNTQCVYRFAIIQIVAAAIAVLITQIVR